MSATSTDARKSSAEVAFRAIEDLAHEAEQNVGSMLRMVGEAQQAAAPPPASSPDPMLEPAARPAAEFAAARVRELDARVCLRLFPVLTPGYDPAYIAQFRQLRAKMHLYRDAWTREQVALSVISVASPARRDGKTFVAANLAAAIASSGENRVLLIDANPFSPAAGSILGLAPQGGFCEALKGAAWADFLWRVPDTDLCILPFGAVRANAIEPFSYKQLPKLLKAFRAAFDWIVIDGPSFDHPADAELINHQADGCLLVVQKGQTRFDAMHQAMRRLPQHQILGVVLNGRTKA